MVSGCDVITSDGLSKDTAEAIATSARDVLKAERDGSATKELRKSNCSKHFVSCLAKRLLAGFPRSSSSLIAWYLDKSENGVKSPAPGEFLWDIFVGENLAERGSRATILGAGLLAVEIELKNSVKKLQRDFDKLLVAKTNDRVFVMPQLSRKKEKQVLDGFRMQSERTGSSCFVVMIPPLKKWHLGDHPINKRVARSAINVVPLFVQELDR